MEREKQPWGPALCITFKWGYTSKRRHRHEWNRQADVQWKKPADHWRQPRDGRATARLAAVTREIRQDGGECAWVHCDVTRPEEVAAMVLKTVDTYGGLDLAYNNAGISHPPLMPLDVTDELWRRVFEVNVYASSPAAASRYGYSCSRAGAEPS